MNFTGHLLPEEAAAFVRADGGLPPAERLAISDHAAGCAACRGLLADARGAVDGLPHIFAGLIEAGRQETSPEAETWGGAEEFSAGLPGYTPAEREELRTFQKRLDQFEEERFVPGGTLDPAGRAVSRRNAVPEGARGRGWQRLFSWQGVTLTGAAVAVVLALAAILLRGQTSRYAPSGVVVRSPRVDIADGPLQVSANGVLEGLAAVPEDLREAVAEAVRRGAAPGALLGKLTRGGAENASAPVVPDDLANPGPIFPVRTSVEMDLPTFRWRAPSMATNVEVMLRPSAGGEEIRSLPIPAGTTEWIPPTPLARGALYRWRVVLVTPEGQEVPPAMDARQEAVFKVLSAEAHARLESLRGSPGGRSHLALGVAYAREGLREEATREFRALKAGNAQSALAQKLVDSLEGKGG